MNAVTNSSFATLTEAAGPATPVALQAGGGSGTASGSAAGSGVAGFSGALNEALGRRGSNGEAGTGGDSAALVEGKAGRAVGAAGTLADATVSGVAPLKSAKEADQAETKSAASSALSLQLLLAAALAANAGVDASASAPVSTPEKAGGVATVPMSPASGIAGSASAGEASGAVGGAIGGATPATGFGGDAGAGVGGPLAAEIQQQVQAEIQKQVQGAATETITGPGNDLQAAGASVEGKSVVDGRSFAAMVGKELMNGVAADAQAAGASANAGAAGQTAQTGASGGAQASDSRIQAPASAAAGNFAGGVFVSALDTGTTAAMAVTANAVVETAVAGAAAVRMVATVQKERGDVGGTERQNPPAAGTDPGNAAQSKVLSALGPQIAALEGSVTKGATTPTATIEVGASTGQAAASGGAGQLEWSKAAARAGFAAPFLARNADTMAAGTSGAKGAATAQVSEATVGATQNTAQSTTAGSGGRTSAQDSQSNGGTDSAGRNATSKDAASGTASSNAGGSSAASAATADTTAPAVAAKADVAAAASATATGAPAPVVPAALSQQAPAQPAASASQTAAAPSQPALPPAHLPSADTVRMVSDAQLTNAANQSEMRIALQTDKLGGIELHARMSGDEMGAAIVVEKRDAHAVLAAELPSLQQALADKQLRVNQVALSQGSLGATAGDAGASGQSGQRAASQAWRWTAASNEPREAMAAAWFIAEPTQVFTAQGRLSVQA